MSFATKDILLKLEHYCAYQERCHYDVHKKLYDLRIPEVGHDEIIHHLISNNYLNEERFVKAYVKGKFRLKKWGKVKISIELKTRKISDYLIQLGLEEINFSEYREACETLYDKKISTLRDSKQYIRQQKAVRFIISKGYEPNLAWEISKEKQGQ